MNRIVISQPRYLPSPAYLYRFALADEFIYLDTVQYSPRDWENRNLIKGQTGSQWLSVPVIKSSSRQKICDTRIDNSMPWRKKHLNSLRLNYTKAPFFDAIYPCLEQHLIKKWHYLSELNVALCNELLKILGFECRIIMALPLNVTGQSSQLLLNLCLKRQADVYLSGSLGKTYLDTALFDKAGISWEFHHFTSQPYTQLHGEFVPHLSAIDLLFNLPVKHCCQYMEKHSHIEVAG